MRMNIPWPFSDHLIILFVSLCAFLLSLFFVMVRYRLGLPEQFQILGALIRPSKPPLLMNRSCTVFGCEILVASYPDFTDLKRSFNSDFIGNVQC